MENPFTIREATMADVPALAALHVTTFKETHGWMDAPTLATRLWQWKNIFQDKNESWFCLVIEKDGKDLIGFAKGQPYNHPDHPAFAGELNKIYILRKYHRLGLGRQLIDKVAHEFIQRGVKSMLLFGDRHNPSNGFYERMGGKKLLSENGQFHGGYGWVDLQHLIIARQIK